MKNRKNGRADAVQKIMDTPPSFTDPRRQLDRSARRRIRDPRPGRRRPLSPRRPRLPSQGPIPPIRGKCPEGTKGVGMLARRSRD